MCSKKQILRFITSKEKAKEREREQEKKNKKKNGYSYRIIYKKRGENSI